ncbi:MAG: YaaC family protein [Pseudomonadota bacterium]
MSRYGIELLDRSSTPDIFAWRRLARYTNTKYVHERIIDLHNITKTHKSNAKKQADQVRYCVEQAKAYYDSSINISDTISPLLMYYCCMSLSLAEILLYQTGVNSIDNAREKHSSHGLQFDIKGKPVGDAEIDLENLGSTLSASGTFVLWMESTKFTPMIGERIIYKENIKQHRYLPLLSETNKCHIPNNKISLLNCIKHIPLVSKELSHIIENDKFARGVISEEIDERNSTNKFNFLTHPSPEHTIKDLSKLIKISPYYYERTHAELEKNWIRVNIKRSLDDETTKIHTPNIGMEFPGGFNLSKDEIYFYPDLTLNQLGYFYVGLFICSNLVRYYPDYWVDQIHKRTDTALAIETFTKVSRELVPILSLELIENKCFLME